MLKDRFLLLFVIVVGAAQAQTTRGLWDYKNQRALKGRDSVFQQYIPAELTKRKLYYQREIEIDSNMVKGFSEFLTHMGMPTWSREYLGGESYRFSWRRSFHFPIVVIVRSANEGYEVLSFIGNKVEFDRSYNDVANLTPQEYLFLDDFAKGLSLDSARYRRIYRKMHHSDLVKFEVTEQRKKISEKQWDALKKLLETNNIIKQPPVTRPDDSTDGAAWILEANLKDGYKFIYRRNPDKENYPEFREICEMIIDLSEFKKEERY